MNEKCITCGFDFDRIGKILKIMKNKYAPEDKKLIIVDNDEMLKYAKSSIKDKDLFKSLKILKNGTTDELAEGAVSNELHDQINSIIYINKLLNYSYDIPIFNNIHSSRYLSDLFVLEKDVEYIDFNDIEKLNEYIKTLQNYIYYINSLGLSYDNTSELDNYIDKLKSLKPHIIDFNENADTLYEILNHYNIKYENNLATDITLLEDIKQFIKKPCLIDNKDDQDIFLDLLKRYQEINDKYKDSKYYITNFKNKNKHINSLILSYNKFISNKLPSGVTKDILKDKEYFESLGFNLFNLLDIENFRELVLSHENSTLIRDRNYYLLDKEFSRYFKKNSNDFHSTFKKYQKKLDKYVRFKLSKTHNKYYKNDDEHIIELFKKIDNKLKKLSVNINCLLELEMNENNLDILLKNPQKMENKEIDCILSEFIDKNSSKDLNLTFEEFLNNEYNELMNVIDSLFKIFDEKYNLESTDIISDNIKLIKNSSEDLKIDVNSLTIGEYVEKSNAIVNKDNNQLIDDSTEDILNKYNAENLEELTNQFINRFNEFKSKLDSTIYELFDSVENLNLLIKAFNQIESYTDQLSNICIKYTKNLSSLDIVTEIIHILNNNPTYIDDPSRFNEYIDVITYLKEDTHNPNINKLFLKNTESKLNSIKNYDSEKKFSELSKIINDFSIKSDSNEFKHIFDESNSIAPEDSANDESKINTIYNSFYDYILDLIDDNSKFESYISSYSTEVDPYFKKYTPNSFFGLTSNVEKIRNEWKINLRYTNLINTEFLDRDLNIENLEELNDIRNELIILKNQISDNIAPVFSHLFKYVQIENVDNLKNTCTNLLNEIDIVKDIYSDLKDDNLEDLIKINKIDDLNSVPFLIKWDDELFDIEKYYNQICSTIPDFKHYSHSTKNHDSKTNLSNIIQSVSNTLKIDLTENTPTSSFIKTANNEISRIDKILSIKNDISELSEKSYSIENKLSNCCSLVGYAKDIQELLDIRDYDEKLENIHNNLQTLSNINSSTELIAAPNNILDIYNKYEINMKFSSLLDKGLINPDTLNNVNSINIKEELDNIHKYSHKLNELLLKNNMEYLKSRLFDDAISECTNNFYESNEFYRNITQKVKKCNINNFIEVIEYLKKELSFKTNDKKLNKIIINFNDIKEIIDLSNEVNLSNGNDLFEYNYNDLKSFHKNLKKNIEFTDCYNDGLFNENIFKFYGSNTFSDDLDNLEMKLMDIKECYDDSNIDSSTLNSDTEHLEELIDIKSINDECKNLFNSECTTNIMIKNYQIIINNLLKLCNNYPIKNNQRTSDKDVKAISKLTNSKIKINKYIKMYNLEKKINSYETLITVNLGKIWKGYSTNIHKIENKFKLDSRFTELYGKGIISKESISNIDNFSRSDLKKLDKIENKLKVSYEKIYSNEDYNYENIYHNNELLIKEINLMEKSEIYSENYLNNMSRINSILNTNDLTNLIRALRIKISNPEKFDKLHEFRKKLNGFVEFEKYNIYNQNSLNKLYNDIKYTQLINLEIITEEVTDSIRNNWDEFSYIMNAFQEYRLLIIEQINNLDSFDLTTHLDILLNESKNKTIFLLNEEEIKHNLSKEFTEYFDAFFVLKECSEEKIQFVLEAEDKVYTNR